MEETKLFFNDLLDSPVDERDHVWDNICGISVDDTPDEWISPWYNVRDQKNTMWCMSFASTGLWEIVEYMVSAGKNKLDFSKEFVMYNAKDKDGSPTTQGTYGRTIAENAIKLGFCPENLCPTTYKGELKGEIKKPSDVAFKEALKHKPEGYAKVADLNGILTAIYNNGGVFTSLLYYSDMLRPSKGFIRRPPETSARLGGHSTVWIGYSKTKKAKIGGEDFTGFFIQLNAYGETQGRFGIELIPFDVLNWAGGRYHYSSDKIFREAWTFYYKKDVKLNKFFIDNQPKEVIKDAKSINLKFKLDSKTAYVDGKAVTMDTAPKIINGISFVPFRFIFNAMDCKVDYTQKPDGHHFIRATDKNTAVTVDLNIGYTVGYVDGKEYVMLQAPFVENGRTFVPLRAIGDMLGCKVDFNPKTREITIVR